MVSFSNERRILIVEHDPAEVDIVRLALEWEAYASKVASTRAEALSLIEKWKPDLILLSQEVPDIHSYDILRDLRASNNYTAVMFLSASATPEMVVQGLDSGADDFMSKPFDPRELLARIKAHLRTKDLYDELRSSNLRLQELVDVDDLTGLLNMRTIYQRIENELERARRHRRQICVIMMDMDHFKTVNDDHNHLFGSFVLTEVGKTIRQSIRSIDIGARYGGDEFLIVLTEITEEGAKLFCERLLKRIRDQLFQQGGDQIRLTASLGYTMTDNDTLSLDAQSLLRIADAALYEAKGRGRNTFWYIPAYTPIKKPA